MILDVVTQEGARVKGLEVSDLTVPGVLGEMGILPSHIPMIAGLGIGVMIAVTAEGAKRFALSGGFIEVFGEEIRILTESCESATAIDVDRAKNRLEQATGRLGEMYPGQGTAYTAILNSVKKAETRLEVAAGGKHRT